MGPELRILRRELNISNISNIRLFRLGTEAATGGVL